LAATAQFVHAMPAASATKPPGLRPHRRRLAPLKAAVESTDSQQHDRAQDADDGHEWPVPSLGIGRRVHPLVDEIGWSRTTMTAYTTMPRVTTARYSHAAGHATVPAAEKSSAAEAAVHAIRRIAPTTGLMGRGIGVVLRRAGRPAADEVYYHLTTRRAFMVRGGEDETQRWGDRGGCAVLLMSLWLPSQAGAQAKQGVLDKDTFMDMETVSNPAISPDGSSRLLARLGRAR